MRCVYGGQVRREPADCSEYSDHRPDLTLLLEGLLTVFDLKVFAPIGSDAGEVELRGGFVGLPKSSFTQVPRRYSKSIGRMVALVRKGGDTTTRTGIETAGCYLR